ncbi:hypothetical protein C368_03364 [Cryptococcus neoformans 125.91]|nr:hypothetical protein C368_03364 [Cryptococcus neoformans var. grubii 125.91]
MFPAHRQSPTSSSSSAIIPLNHPTASTGNSPSSDLASQGTGSGNSDNLSTNADGNGKQRPRRKVTIVPPVTAACLEDLRSALPTGAIVPNSSQANVPSTPGLPHPTTEVSTAGTSSKRRRAHTVSVCLPNSAKYVQLEDKDDQAVPQAARAGKRGARRQWSHDIELGMSLTDTNPTHPPFTSALGPRHRSISAASQPVAYSNTRQRGRRSSSPGPVGYEMEGRDGDVELGDELVGVLDVIDPQVSTVNHLQNMCNSVMVPYLPQLWTRRPEVQLPSTPSDEDIGLLNNTAVVSRRRSNTTRSRRRTLSLSRFVPSKGASESTALAAEDDNPPATAPASWGGAHPLSVMEEEPEFQPQDSPIQSLPSALATKQLVPSSTTSLPLPAKPTSLTSSPTASTISLRRSTLFDKHIKSVLSTSTRQKILLALQGLWTFVKTPMGFLTALYGFAVVFWGAAIVLFLLGWIPTSSKYRQDVWVEISSQVENGLFTVTGVGLIPWRVVDTYRMSVIWTLKSRAERRREKMGLPPIEDENDLPDPQDIPGYIHVLDEKETARLRHHQEKFALSQTWYKPHATATHRAFPIGWALWNTILMDGNSFFQCILCGCMWGMNWHKRPAWTTGCLIPLSFLCGIGAAVLIYCGSVKTKKHQAVSEKLKYAMGIPLAIGQPAMRPPGVGEDPTSKERGKYGGGDNENDIAEEGGGGREGERTRAQPETAPDGGVMVGVGSGDMNRERLSGDDERDNGNDNEDETEGGEKGDRQGAKHGSSNVFTPLLGRNKHHPQRRATVTFGPTISASPHRPLRLHPQPPSYPNRHHHLLQRHHDNTMSVRLRSPPPSPSPSPFLGLKVETETPVKPGQQEKNVPSIGVRRVESDSDEKGDIALDGIRLGRSKESSA